jgi:flagellin-like hook-associated protein FlgL
VAEVNLSKAVRSNLLSLQSTAASMAKTQERLATGLKVNSALDNPTNFFTAASLNSRAGDMSNLLDSMSNGIKTIEAADNGLSSITKTVESMQSTLRQARQDKSFKTQSFTMDPARAGLLEFTGGAVGGTAVGVSLGSAGAVQSTFAASTDFTTPGDGSVTFAFSPDNTPFGAGDTISFDLTQTGAFPTTTWNVGLSGANLPFLGGGDSTIDDIDDFTQVLDQVLAAYGFATSVSNDGANVTIASTAGPGSNLTIGAVDGDVDNGGSINTAFGITPSTGIPSSPITISNGTSTANINLTNVNAPDAATTRAYIQSQLTAQGVTGITVGGSGNRIDLQGAANGSNTITVGGAGAAATFGTSGTQLAGATAGTYSVDQLAQSINTNAGLKDKVRASNDNGKLRIENLSTEELTVHGVGSDGEIDGTSGTTDIGGNEVRKNLVKQFNELRDQLDKLADDASFNGINLLRGDKLKLTFNETGTSTIDIQAKDADGDPTSINNATLDIASAIFADFDSDASLDARLGKLSDALGKLRSQASAFGSNLSIVENRNDFTKSMINTLETGAANLTLADTNQEAANLLALQTRQQLSSTALSMASQADQAVLRLF